MNESVNNIIRQIYSLKENKWRLIQLALHIGRCKAYAGKTKKLRSAKQKSK